MADCLGAAEIDSLLAGTLSPEQADRAQAHLAECEACHTELEARRAEAELFDEIRQACQPETVSLQQDADALSEDASPEPLPQFVEGYKILSEIHHGGQGVVYQAIQKATKRTVALKVLLEGPYAPARHRLRFEREIDLAASLRHPNIVTIYDSGVTRDGRRYLAMEYIHGRPLNLYLHEVKLDTEDVLRLFAKICAAISFAHQRGVIHRDLKPGNIQVDADGEPHILDFGLAKTAGTSLTDRGAPVTVTGEFMGTLAYASPEQTKGDPDQVDVRTDVYSLGVILYEMLTGAFPYAVIGELTDVLKNIVEVSPKKPSTVRAQIDGELDTIVLKALTKEKERRYQSADALGREVERLLQGEPIEARRDSVRYVLHKRFRRFVHKHRGASLLAAIIAATLLAEVVVTPLVFDWTPAANLFERFVAGHFSSLTYGPALESVRLIALTAATPVEQIASREGLAGVTPRHLKSLRRLHGRLMEKLARTGVRCVVWDITFRGETQFDQDLVRGVRALRDAGVGVVVSGGPWWFDRGSPQLSGIIAPEVRWGATQAGFGPRAAWRLDLLAQRGFAEPLPSLALAAIAAYRHPQAEARISLDPLLETADLLFFQRDPRLPQARKWLPDPVHITLSAVQDERDDSPDFGLKRGDKVAYFWLDMPPDSVLEASTVPYESVFAADEGDLRTWFAGKVAVVGDLRTGIDRYDHPDGRSLGGCQGHAVGIDALLRQISIRRPKLVVASGVTTAGAALGCLVALIAPARPLRRTGILALLTVTAVFGSIMAYGQLHYLFNPFIAVAALVAACELSALVNRAYRARW